MRPIGRGRCRRLRRGQIHLRRHDKRRLRRVIDRAVVGPSVAAADLCPIPTQPSMEFHISPSARAGLAASKAASATPLVAATRLRVLRESKGKAHLLRRCRQSLIIPQFTAICWQAGLFGRIICPGLFGQPFKYQKTHPDTDRHICEVEYIPGKSCRHESDKNQQHTRRPADRPRCRPRRR